MNTAPSWIATPHLLPDYRGPVGRRYRPSADPATAPPIIETLAGFAATTPDAPALVDTEGTLSFAAMLDAVARLAGAIAATPTTGRVGILLGNDRHYVIAVFACLVADRLSVLLDATFPEARNAAIAAATGADLVLTTAGADLNWPGVTVLAADQAYPPAALPQQQLDPDAPAFILCTSGSSGQPKPIVHSQRTMLNWTRTTHNALHVTPDDRALSLSSLSSLGGFVALLGYPLAGASLQLIDLKTAGLSGLIQTLAEQPVTVLRAAPSMLRSLTGLPAAAAALSQLRVVQTYGEPMLLTDVAALRQALAPDCHIRSTYGSTESSGLSWYAAPDDPYDPARVPAGVLMPDTEAAILADDGGDCQRGTPGELVIRSRYNALGEWIDGAVRPGRLLPDPAAPGLRIYATGDIASCSDDGVFVVLGRKDRMLNINGQRVEPAEIERVLEGCPGVARAEVIIVKRDSGDTMAAFLVAAPGAGDDLPAAARAAVRNALPAYMMPSRILAVDAIPTLPSGKTDLQALQALVAR